MCHWKLPMLEVSRDYTWFTFPNNNEGPDGVLVQRGQAWTTFTLRSPTSCFKSEVKLSWGISECRNTECTHSSEEKNCLQNQKRSSLMWSRLWKKCSFWDKFVFFILVWETHFRALNKKEISLFFTLNHCDWDLTKWIGKLENFSYCTSSGGLKEDWTFFPVLLWE